MSAQSAFAFDVFVYSVRSPGWPQSTWKDVARIHAFAVIKCQKKPSSNIAGKSCRRYSWSLGKNRKSRTYRLKIG